MNRSFVSPARPTHADGDADGLTKMEHAALEILKHAPEMTVRWAVLRANELFKEIETARSDPQ